MILQRRSTTYYPQANGQANTINMVLWTILTKMVNAYHTDWDIKLHITLRAYHTAYKVITKHIFSLLVFETKVLHPIAYIEGNENNFGLMNYIQLWINEWSASNSSLNTKCCRR